MLKEQPNENGSVIPGRAEGLLRSAMYAVLLLLVFAFCSVMVGIIAFPREYVSTLFLVTGVSAFMLAISFMKAGIQSKVRRQIFYGVMWFLTSLLSFHSFVLNILILAKQ